MKYEIDLTHLVPEFPIIPYAEIPRDSLVNRLARSFGSTCQKQIVISNDHYGKTNLLSQFCRQFPQNSISYFITSNPTTHNLRTFLYVICNQISKILYQDGLSERISETELKSIYVGLTLKLAEFAKKHNQIFYFVIDGIDTIINSDYDQMILSNLPNITTASPYLLLSSTPSSFDKLPEYIKKNVEKCEYEAALQFNSIDIEQYFSDFRLSLSEITKINEKSKGVAGYLEVLRDSIKISGTDLIYSGYLPDNLVKLISNQVDRVFSDCTQLVWKCIEIIAVAPKPIAIELIEKITGNVLPLDQLNVSGLIIIDNKNNYLSFKQEIAKKIIVDKIGKGHIEIKQKLLVLLKENEVRDEELLTLLLEELSDYCGLVRLLDTDIVRKAINSGEIEIILDRMRKTSKLAFSNKSIKDTIKWIWNLTAVREFIDHASTPHEINALIAIGESQKALEMAYAFPEEISKIRLLSRVYASMKEKKEHIPQNALDEIDMLVEEIDISKLETEIIQDLAIDILPILPDKAVSLLEKIIGEPKEQGLIDIAISTVKSSIGNVGEDIISKAKDNYSDRKPSIGKLLTIKSSWLHNVDLAHLIRDVEDLESTKAKEFMIRQWCLQNINNDELSYGIEFWLDTVIHDDIFVISLRSLRQLSYLIIDLEKIDRRRLIERFQISIIDSLRTPWEEWVGFHLNLAEALFSLEPANAKEKIEIIYQIINTEINDYDIKVFCYARLWGTYQRMGLEQGDDVKNNLERVLSHLLRNAALQDEILIKTLSIIAGIDINYALEISNRLNTVKNINSAKKVILIYGYRKLSNEDLSVQLKNVLNGLDKFEQDEYLSDLIEELSVRNIVVDQESQRILFYKSKLIYSQIDKSVTLVNLASIWSNEQVIRIEKILEEAKLSWQNEDDLKKKIIGGFYLVEQIARFDKKFAKEFCEEVQCTLSFPGAELAIGGLGTMYVSSIELAIRSLTQFHIKDPDSLEQLYDQINFIPATLLRFELLAQLAARLYSIGIYPLADDIVSEKIISKLSDVKNQYLRERIIDFSLPVIFLHSPETAISLSKELPRSKKNFCWLRVILWLLTKGYLDDSIDINTIKVSSNSATIRDKALYALMQIDEDIVIFMGIKAITHSIEYSVQEHKLDTKSAFDILLEIETFSSKKLPDGYNIKHPGYKIVCIARINGTQSRIYQDVNRKGPFNKIDIKEKWRDLELQANQKIDNLADRVFVLTYIAEEMRKWDINRAEILLDSLKNEINNIPSILDRADRTDNIAKTLGLWGQKKQAKYLYSQSIELLNELSSMTRDKKLEQIIQAAYEISPDFADEIVERIDSRFPDKELPPFKLKLKSLLYSQNLEKLISDSQNNHSPLQGFLIKLCVNNLMKDLISQNGYLPKYQNLLELIYESSFHSLDVVDGVLKWAMECEARQQQSYQAEFYTNYISSAQFILALARLLPPYERKGISKEIYGKLPGLSSKVVVFQAGDRKKAESWMKNWIRINAQKYIKICDPYFGPKELSFLCDIERDIKILIITTNEKFVNKENKDQIQQELIETWRRVGKGKMPSMTLLIVPSTLERTFHDRAIITDNSGLDIGPSLNALGIEMQKITELDYAESREIEEKYINNMLNQGIWYLNHSMHPEYIVIE